MFVDNNKIQKTPQGETPYGGNGYGQPNYNKKGPSDYIMYVVYLIIILVAGGIFFLMKNKPTTTHIVTPTPQPEATTTPEGQLPIDETGSEGNGNDSEVASTTIKAEDLVFGNYYNTPEKDYISSIKSYDLPINIKVDVSNYYDFSRKINLDPYIEELNNEGFAVLDNQFPGEYKDFYAFYNYMLTEEIPVVLTSDLLLYYYQNNLKQIFKEIEKNAFYKNVWDIYFELYEIARARYNRILIEKGSENDPILEGARLEVTYFAVALNLLKPQEKQINDNSNLQDESKFNKDDVVAYDYLILENIKESVEKEEALIRYANRKGKSPILLYDRDYSYFTVPTEYKSNAKLNNFYLAMKWANSVFPLYYKSQDCEDCLLDKDDWIINAVAANFITKDFSDNQNIKNQWAIIYKFISHFSGLRDDLTYLHYDLVMKANFGDEYNIEQIFSTDNANRDEDLKKMQNELAKLSFSPMKGSLPRNDKEYKPYIGMRMLQESYWPNDYIFSQVVGKDMLYSDDRVNFDVNNTYCATTNGGYYRCRALGSDIVDILHPYQHNSYTAENINYNFYDEKITLLKDEIGRFNEFAWNDNVYWVSLDLGKKLLDYNKNDYPVFMRGSKWEKERAYNTFLGSWVNLHLPADILASGQDNLNTTTGGFSSSLRCDVRSYVEPNIELISDMMARNEMLKNMIEVLKVSKDTNAAALMLKEINRKFGKIKEVMIKEVNNEEFVEDDCITIRSFVKLHSVDTYGDKEFDANGFTNIKDISNLKMVVIVYQKGDRKILATGPIFNYNE